MINIISEDFKRRLLSGEVFTDNLKVDGYLDLIGCTSLESLPENLKVDGYLDLIGCTSLESLPDNLKVNCSLDLKGCTSLNPPSPTISVRGEVLCDESLIDSIPEIDLPLYIDFKFNDNIKKYLLKKMKNSSCTNNKGVSLWNT